MEEFLSLKKSMARFLFNGEGLDVHLVDLFCFAPFLPAVLLPNEFSQPLHLHLSAEHYQKYSKGIWIVVGLAHRCMHP